VPARIPNYNPGDAKVYGYNRWYANTGSIPDNVSKFRAVGAMKRGRTNIFKVKDSCGLPDRVKGVSSTRVEPRARWT
jgi:hypothetical protein